MEKKGKLVICDKPGCKNWVFLEQTNEDGWGAAGEPHYELLPAEWEESTDLVDKATRASMNGVAPHHLCPEHAVAYKEMLRNFWADLEEDKDE